MIAAALLACLGMASLPAPTSVAGVGGGRPGAGGSFDPPLSRGADRCHRATDPDPDPATTR